MARAKTTTVDTGQYLTRGKRKFGAATGVGGTKLRVRQATKSLGAPIPANTTRMRGGKQVGRPTELRAAQGRRLVKIFQGSRGGGRGAAPAKNARAGGSKG